MTSIGSGTATPFSRPVAPAAGVGTRIAGPSGVGDAAEATVALLVVADRLVQELAVEVGPEHGREPQLCVGRLPEQEIGDAHLPSRPDQKVGVWDSGVVKPRRDGVGGDAR